MIYYALSIFVSAFLLFQIQPMIARYILPWFGGTPAVWSTVQLFFQVFLTGGYAYTAWLIGRVPARKQVWVHITMLAASLLGVLALGLLWPSPVTPDTSWKPLSVDTPIADIFKLLFVAVGLPYFLLSTNSPLMQAWFNRALPGRSPYWLYALSNIGSLLGLAAYPFIVEPMLTLKEQGWAWTGGYVLFVLLASYGALRSTRAAAEAPGTSQATESSAAVAKPSMHLQGLWLLLSAIASTMLLATTSQITQEVAPIPFLWVLPLAIYLFSFILTFSSERWYNRTVFGVLMLAATAAFVWALVATQAHFVALIVAYSFTLFVCVMICHGELYRLRPDPAYLTRFYLMTSIGGALGGVAVNLVAPFVFKGYWELPISFGLTWALVLAVFMTRNSTNRALRVRFIHNVVAGTTVLLVGAFSLYALTGGKTSGAVFEERNFYGVVRVKEIYPDDVQWQGYNMAHGITIHGVQFTAPDKRRLPTAYFARESGIGLAMVNHPKYGRGMRVGILGLGIGTLAAYGQPGDVYRLYEINPIMVDLADGRDGYFSFLADSPADNTVVLGDARISLERELAAGGSDGFDLLAMDAFSSDSVPVHLITKEAFDIYLKHLAPEGFLAVNISNRHLDLVPVLWQLAKYYQLNMIVIPTQGEGRLVFTSNWVLIARDAALLQTPAIAQRAISMDNYSTNIPLWTDDFSNLFQILK
jgi:spermidine synthase